MTEEEKIARYHIFVELDKFMVAEIRDAINKAIDGKKSVARAAHDCSDSIIAKLKSLPLSF